MSREPSPTWWARAVTDQPSADDRLDPVLVQRAKVKRWAGLAQRIGGACFAIDLVLVVVALTVGLTTFWTDVLTWLLIAGCAILAPAILVAYMVRAADRADRENDW